MNVFLWQRFRLTRCRYLQDLALARDDQSRPSCDSGRLSSMLGEDDLLRVDMTELESIPFSELYLGEGGSTTTRANTPRLVCVPNNLCISRYRAHLNSSFRAEPDHPHLCVRSPLLAELLPLPWRHYRSANISPGCFKYLMTNYTSTLKIFVT